LKYIQNSQKENDEERKDRKNKKMEENQQRKLRKTTTYTTRRNQTGKLDKTNYNRPNGSRPCCHARGQDTFLHARGWQIGFSLAMAPCRYLQLHF
jgi:hypothetical protein